MGVRSILSFTNARHIQNMGQLINASYKIPNRLSINRTIHQKTNWHKSASKKSSYIWWTVGSALGTCGYLLAHQFGFGKNFPFPHVSAFGLGLMGRREQLNFIADVSDIAMPAVVYVEMRDTKRFNHITGQHVPISAGSGFVVRPDGLIITNAHVVLQKMAKNSTLKVVTKLYDGRIFEAEIESVDKDSDLATLRIPTRNLPVIKLGRSIGLKPGEWVLALGSPLALSNTVTAGIVSAYRKSAELGLQQSQTVYIQTDASINNGNSGGPLMNVEGEAIGINSMNIIPGISFATPIDLVTKFLEQSSDETRRIQIKKVAENYRYIGIVMLTLTSEILGELNRSNVGLSPKVHFGVLIQRIIPGSPAEE